MATVCLLPSSATVTEADSVTDAHPAAPPRLEQLSQAHGSGVLELLQGRDADGVSSTKPSQLTSTEPLHL
jgi:hypothetical protein